MVGDAYGEFLMSFLLMPDVKLQASNADLKTDPPCHARAVCTCFHRGSLTHI